MGPVKVKHVVIGEGMPKICVPAVGRTREEILEEAKRIRTLPADLAEWRADWYADIFHPEETEKTLRELKNALEGLPLLFTFRTAGEGGEREIGAKAYLELNAGIAMTGMADLLDVELSAGTETVAALIRTAHENQVKVIVSSHDFRKTPPEGEILSRLNAMQDLGADILKIAVMPQDRRDVLTLLSATEEMTEKYAKCPVISMSMGKLGMASRICGGLSGSAVTFGSAGKVSAPGQIEAGRLKEALELLYQDASVS